MIGRLKDDVKPKITITSPADGDIITEGTGIIITAKTVDLGGIKSVTFIINGEDYFTDYTPTPKEVHAPYSFEYLVPFGWPGRSITFGALATDPTGNVGEAQEVSIEVGLSTQGVISGIKEYGDFSARGILVKDNTTYVIDGDGSSSLRIYDVLSAPEKPALLGIESLLRNGMRDVIPSLNGGTCLANTLTLDEYGLAYVVGSGEMQTLDGAPLSANLQIIDVRNPFNPEFITCLDLPLDNINDIEVRGNLALIAAGEAGL